MEGFVQREDKTIGGVEVKMVESQMKCESAEEVNLLHMIETQSQSLMKSLNAIESLTNALNKNLLPAELQGESKTPGHTHGISPPKVEAKKPQGWLENYLADLGFLISRAEQIHCQVNRLIQATKVS